MKKEQPKWKFRKNCIDLVLAVPQKEGTTENAPSCAIRVDLKLVSNIDYMNSVFRQMLATIAHQDEVLKPIFEQVFRNQALDEKRIQDLANRALKRAAKNTKRRKLVEAKAKAYEESNEEGTPSSEQNSSPNS